MKKIPTILLAMFTALLSACSSVQLYEGEKLPPSHIVKIKGMSSLDITAGGFAAKICRFDDQILSPCQPFIEFLPGEHVLMLQSSRYGIANESITLRKKFNAGETYLLGLSFDRSGTPFPALMSLKN